jgi:hypothetical protein
MPVKLLSVIAMVIWKPLPDTGHSDFSVKRPFSAQSSHLDALVLIEE